MNWLALNWPQVFELAGYHLLLTVPAIIVSVLIAVPIGWLSFRHPRLGGPLLGAASLLYAIPALPLLIIIPVIFGVALRSNITMIIALSLYGIALMVRTAADAFAQVDPQTRAAATAIGYSSSRVFWTVELPLAVPVMIAGVRVVAVSTVGLVTIGVLIGVPNLGTLLTDGFQRGITGEVVTGVIATVILALVLDALILLAGRLLTPWTRVRATSRRRVATA